METDRTALALLLTTASLRVEVVMSWDTGNDFAGLGEAQAL
jgi:hypothetical protein